jgi:hypothetical protein
MSKDSLPSDSTKACSVEGRGVVGADQFRVRRLPGLLRPGTLRPLILEGKMMRSIAAKFLGGLVVVFGVSGALSSADELLVMPEQCIPAAGSPNRQEGPSDAGRNATDALQSAAEAHILKLRGTLAGDNDPDLAYLCASAAQTLGAIALAEAQLVVGHDVRVKDVALAMIAAKYEELATIFSMLETDDLR